jgi:hypothetical protein
MKLNCENISLVVIILLFYNINSQIFCDYHKKDTLQRAGRLALTCPYYYPPPQPRDLEKQLAGTLTQPLYG